MDPECLEQIRFHQAMVDTAGWLGDLTIQRLERARLGGWRVEDCEAAQEMARRAWEAAEDSEQKLAELRGWQEE